MPAAKDEFHESLSSISRVLILIHLEKWGLEEFVILKKRAAPGAGLLPDFAEKGPPYLFSSSSDFITGLGGLIWGKQPIGLMHQFVI